MKPPIGIMPRWLWLEYLEGEMPSDIEIKNRKIELKNAIMRYKEKGFNPLLEWIMEYKNY